MTEIWDEVFKHYEVGYGCTIDQVNTAGDWAKVLPRLTEDLSILPVLGMDCEWVPVSKGRKRRPVAMLQLATYSGLCVLVRLLKMKNIYPTCRQVILRLGLEKVSWNLFHLIFVNNFF